MPPTPNINYEEKPPEGPHRDENKPVTHFYGDYGHRTPSIRRGEKRISWSQNLWKGLTEAEINQYLARWKHV